MRTDSYMSTRSARAKPLMLPTFWAIARKLVEACQRPSRQHQEHYSDWADRTRADGPVLLTLTRGICGTSTAAARGAAALRASPLPFTVPVSCHVYVPPYGRRSCRRQAAPVHGGVPWLHVSSHLIYWFFMRCRLIFFSSATELLLTGYKRRQIAARGDCRGIPLLLLSLRR